MIEIKEAVGEVDYQDFYDLADESGLVPDLWKLVPGLAGALHEQRVYLEIHSDEGVIGYLWLDGYIPDLPYQEDMAFGAMVRKEYRGKWAQEADDQLRAVLKTVFTGMKANRLTAYVGLGRRGVERFYNRLGFTFECLRTDATRIKGKVRTVAQLRLTRKEWGDGTRSSDRAGGQPARRAVREEATQEVRLSGDGQGAGA